MALEFWKEKSGPLPNWAWGGLGLGGAVAFASWRRNRAEGAAAQAPATSTTGIQLPESVQPTYAFVDADTTNITWPGVPPGGGRPPVPPPRDPGPIYTVPRPPAKPTLPTPTPTPTPPPPPAPAGQYVTVAKWTPTPVWNSTLWGMAQRLLGNGAQWQSIWNAPQNAALKAKRGKETLIQPGDKIWVPGAK